MSSKEDVDKAIVELRRLAAAGEPIPTEAAEAAANLLEKHREMWIGPNSDGSWPQGWLAVDTASATFAKAVTGTSAGTS